MKQALLIAGVLLMTPAPVMAHSYSNADIEQAGTCIVATLNGYAMENPQLRLGWVPAGYANGLAEVYLFRYGSPEQACKAATFDLTTTIVKFEER